MIKATKIELPTESFNQKARLVNFLGYLFERRPNKENMIKKKAAQKTFTIAAPR